MLVSLRMLVVSSLSIVVFGGNGTHFWSRDSGGGIVWRGRREGVGTAVEGGGCGSGLMVL